MMGPRNQLRWTAALTGLLLASGLVDGWNGPSRTSAAYRADAVTLSVRRYVNANKVRVLVWFGQVASTAAGADVEILGRDCGSRSDRLIAATKTAPGGGWQVENPLPIPPYSYTQVNSGTTFRARWNNQLSAPHLYRLPLQPGAVKISGRRAWKVHVNPSPLNVKLAGKLVELQRFSAGTWVRVRRARLVYKPTLEYGGAYNHEAVFAVPTRGLRLRALLPATSAAPCYLAGASQPWRS